MIGDLPVELVVHDPVVAAAVGFWLAPLATLATPRRRVELAPHDVGHELLIDGVSTYRGSDASNVVDQLIAWCNQTAVSSRPDTVSIHAAALVEPHTRRAVVVPGQPGAGKTTLAAAACAAGWGYLSDELAGLRAGFIEHYAKPLTVKEGTRALLPDEVAQRHLLSDRHRRWYVAVADLGGWVGETAEPGAVVFAEHDPDGPTRAEPVGIAEATLELAVNCQHPLDAHGRQLLELARLADTTMRVRLWHHDLSEAREVLADAVSARPAPGGVSPLHSPRQAGDHGPCANADVVGVRTVDGSVLHRPATDGIALLDPLAGALWQLLDGATTVAELAEDAAAAFGHPVDAVRADLERLVARLTTEGFLRD